MPAKLTLLAAAFTVLAATAIAQTVPPGTPPARAGGTNDPAVVAPAGARALIGRNVLGRDGEVAGTIESVYVATDGKVEGILIGVRGHAVQVARKDLQIADNGAKITIGLTKEELEALPPYSYKDASLRGKVFGDRGAWNDEQRPTADTDRTESTGDFNVSGDVSAAALIGAKVRNESKETVGTVEDLFVDDHGAITAVVVSVGGFLGVGARSVGVKWSDFKRSRDGNSVVLLTSLGKEELKALPPYVVQLRKPLLRDQAGDPR